MHDRSRFPRSDVLVVGVDADGTFEQRSHEVLEKLASDEPHTEPDTLWFESYESLHATLTPQTMELLSVLREHEPRSIREVARLVDRNVSNVHREVTELATLGVIDLIDENGAKRPHFPYRRLVIEPGIVPVGGDHSDEAPA